MTKVAWIADCHLGNHKVMGGPVRVGLNGRCREGLDVFRRAVALADEMGCAAGVVLGDLFDYWRPEPQLVRAVQEILRKARVRWFLLCGNHEQVSGQRGDHALAPLRGVARVVDRPTRISVKESEVLLVPFVPGRPAREWVAEALRSFGPASRPRAVGVHAGVSDAQTPPWLAESLDQVPAQLLADEARRCGASAAFAGNWHSHRSWQLRANDPPPLRSRSSVGVVQVGALVPTGWDNPGLDGYGGLVVWDGCVGASEFHELDGPRFLSVRGLVEARKFLALYGEDERAWWRVRATACASERAAVEDLLRGAGLRGWEVLADPAEVRAEARTAAMAARGADTFDAAVEGFVRGMPLPAGLTDADRPEVAALVRQYVAQGAARG